MVLPQHDMDKRQELHNAGLLDCNESRLKEPILPPKWQKLTLRIRPAWKRTTPSERQGVYYPTVHNKKYRAEVRIPRWKEKVWVGGIDTLAEAMIAVDLLRQFTGREHWHYDFCSDDVLCPTEPHLQPQAVRAYIESLAPRLPGNNLVTLRKEFISCLKKAVEDALYHGGQEVEAPPSSTTASGLDSSFCDDIAQPLADVVPLGKSDLQIFASLSCDMAFPSLSCDMAPPGASKKFDHCLWPLKYLQTHQGPIDGVPD